MSLVLLGHCVGRGIAVAFAVGYPLIDPCLNLTHCIVSHFRLIDPTAPKKLSPTDGVTLSPCGSEAECDRGDLLRTWSFVDRAGTLLETFGLATSTALAKIPCALLA